MEGSATRKETWTGLEEMRGLLRRFLARHSRDENEIEDVIQETFLRAARYRSNLVDVRRLRSWTMRIAVNVLSDTKRRGTRLRSVAPEDPSLELVDATAEGGPGEEQCFRLGRWLLEKDEALGHLQGALAELREDDRRVLGSFYGGLESCRETARECGIPGHLVKIRLFRARQRLLRSIRQRLALGDLASSGVSGA